MNFTVHVLAEICTCISTYMLVGPGHRLLIGLHFLRMLSFLIFCVPVLNVSFTSGTALIPPAVLWRLQAACLTESETWTFLAPTSTFAQSASSGSVNETKVQASSNPAHLSFKGFNCLPHCHSWPEEMARKVSHSSVSLDEACHSWGAWWASVHVTMVQL